jgi:cardiolipin synthase
MSEALSSSEESDMADPLVEFVLEEPEDLVLALADRLERGQVTTDSTDARLTREFVHTPRSLGRMAALLARWRLAGGDTTLLANTLRGHLEVRRVIESRGPRCELVWSGGIVGGSGVRATAPVIREMLGHARRSALVVTYSVWLGDGAAFDVIEQLAACSSAGVDVTFVLDRRYQDGRNLTELRRVWPTGRRAPTVYSWAHEADTIAKLHAKVIVIDRHDVLITSANLTGHGMDGNLELGLRVIGRPAEDTAAHFDQLIRDGRFESVPWA